MYNMIFKIVNRNHFEFLHVVGKGGFGKVNSQIIDLKKNSILIKFILRLSC